MGKVQAKLLAGVLVGPLAAALVLTVDQIFTTLQGGAGVNPLETVELKTYDWRLSTTARPETARKEIALIEIDEFSLRNLEPYFGRWPWPRAAHAILIDYLARGRPKMILYDVNFAGPDTRTGVQVRRIQEVRRRIRPGAGRSGQESGQRDHACRRDI